MAVGQPRVSVIDPISPAFEKVKVILFSPFDLGRWFVIGFCGWLANLGQGGPGFNFGFSRGRAGRDFAFPSDFWQFFGSRIFLVVSIFAGAFLLGVAVAVVLLWVSSRGRFMFLYSVAQNKAEVKAPWHRFRQQGNSLFLFRLAVGVIFFVCAVLLAGIMVPLIALYHRVGGHMIVPLVLGLIFLGLVLAVAGIVITLALKFTQDFVVPIMYLRGCTCIEGWREFLVTLSTNKGRFALYILFQIVIGIVIGWLVITAILLTCCCLGIILVLPYIGTVVMLPVLVFVRAYSLCYLRQYGPHLDVFAAEPSSNRLISGT